MLQTEQIPMQTARGRKFSFLLASFLQISSFVFTIINILYFILYFLLIQNEFSFVTRLQAGGPIKPAFFLMAGGISLLFGLLFTLKRKNPFGRFFAFVLQFCCWFAALFVLFFLVNRIYLAASGTVLAEPTNGTADMIVPDTGYAVLNGTSFWTLIAICCFSFFAALGELFLRAVTIPPAVQYLLHGGTLLVAAWGAEIVFLDGFPNLTSFLLFFLFGCIFYSVFAFAHYYAKQETTKKEESEYTDLFGK